MCFERDDCCNMARAAASEWRQTAQTIRTPCLLAGWTAALQNPPADFPGGGRWNSTGTGESRGGGGVSSRLDRPRIGCLPVAGSRRAAGAAGEAARRPRAGHSQPLLWCDAAGGRGAGGAYSSLLGRLAGLSSVAVAPDRGLACRAAGNWQKMAHASSTQASCRE